MNIQCDNIIAKRKPDSANVNKLENAAIIIDVAIPGEKRITDKEKDKTEKCQNLKGEIQ